jgi:CarD family transcriptional regulator
MYSIGDKVVHPGHGPGIIRGIENRQVIGEAKDYYIIEVLASDITLMTPVIKADELVLRLAMDEAAMERLLALLATPYNELSGDFRERQLDIEERLKEGDIFVTAEIVRDMAWHGHINDLTKRDEQLLQRAEELLASELALVKDIEVKDAIKEVQDILAGAIDSADKELAAP